MFVEHRWDNSFQAVVPWLLAGHIPSRFGVNVAGSALGPSALRTIGLAGALGRLGRRVIDYGDVMPAAAGSASRFNDDCMLKPSEVARWVTSLSKAAYELALGGHVPVFLGGDHSLAMGTVDGIARTCAENGNELFVLWLDAHPDFNTPATSPSGNLHGMSLAFLCGESGFEPVFGVPAHEAVDTGKVYLLGIRPYDVGETRASSAARRQFG